MPEIPGVLNGADPEPWEWMDRHTVDGCEIHFAPLGNHG